MTQARPKRKAASNKNYLDTGAEALFDEIISPPVSAHTAKNGRKRPSSTATPKLSSPASTGSASQGKVPYNWQPPLSPDEGFSHRLNLANAYVDTAKQTLTCPEQDMQPSDVAFSEDDEQRELSRLVCEQLGQKPEPARRKAKPTVFQIKKGNFIYMVSEPPGEPYYIGRVMGFTRKSKLSTPEEEVEDASGYVFQIQWFYRPRDISKNTSDSRLLFALMHSDTCPLSSFRGLVTVKHKLDVELWFQQEESATSSAVEYYLSFPNCFYFDKLFDRYMIKFYDIVKTLTLLQYIDNSANNSRNFILALNKRFEFIFMEASRTKQFINNFHSTLSSHCDICNEWCASNESVTCSGCEKHFHMLCLDPPLLRKPSRGFSWSCALCTKKHELEHQSKRILMLSHDNRLSNEQELSDLTSVSSQDEEEKDPKIKHEDNEVVLPKYELMAIEYLKNDIDMSVEQRRLKEEWSLRYLGIHVRLEDAVDADDRSPYPRASTSLGAKYQASNIPEYEDHPIVYYDIEKAVDSSKSKKGPGGRKVSKKKQETEEGRKLPLPKEFEDVSPKHFPDWLQPRPKGYIERGVDDGEGETCSLMWKPRKSDEEEGFATLDAYIARCEPLAKKLDLHPNSPNFVDAIVKFYNDCDGDVDKAFACAGKLTRKALKEPTFSKEEIKRFEAGIKKYGSELYPTFAEVKTQTCAMVVRYYYLWKKTKRGRTIWGNYPGRKKKGKEKEADMKIKPEVDDYADSEDDSSYENEKIIAKKKLFRCKHCKSYQSSHWYKITGFDGTTKYEEASDDIDPETVTALCFRCAKLWRRYAVYWEDATEVERKNARGIGGYKRKIESELVADSEAILKYSEKLGGGLSYETSKPSCSVLEQSYSNGSAAQPRTKPLPKPKPVSKPAIPKATPPKQPSKKDSTKPVRLTSRQLSLSTKQEAEAKVEAESAKRRKLEVAVKKEAAPAQVKNEPSVKKRAASSKPSDNKRKKKAPTEEKITPKPKAPPRVEEKPEPKAAPSSGRRQRKSPDGTTMVSTIFNPNYRNKLPDIVTLPKLDKKHLGHLSRDVLESIVGNYKFRQLIDMKLVILTIQMPQNVKIELPFNVHERNCCVCFEHDEKEDSLQEMLICSNCGVNVHASCAGLSILGKQKPVKQWLCDACTNDMFPNYSTQYSCCLCMAKDCNEGLAILGASLAKPDYLVPIFETGRWCHLTCAFYACKDIAFRSVPVPSFISKDVLNATNVRSIGCVVESVSRIFVKNYTSQCGICKSCNGALIECDACGENSDKFHVTCAQDTPNFKLGFKIVTQKVSKANTNTYVDESFGKLEPILLCPKHDQRGRIMSMRKLGKRSPNGESKPLITLFIEDLTRSTNPKFNGPQLRAHNYIEAIKRFMETESKLANRGVEKEIKELPKSCKFCSITSSPKWWKIEDGSGAAPDKVVNGTANGGTHVESYTCQNCHLLERGPDFVPEKPEGDAFAEELHAPLNGELFGIKSPEDCISSVYKSAIRKELTLERLKITLGDLLT